MLRRHSFAWLVVLSVAIPFLSIAGTPQPNSNADGGALPEGAVLVGMAEIDITHDFPVCLAGYAGRMDEAGEVIARLSGKALAIGGDDSDELAMVFLPGEVTIDYALRLKGELDGSQLWVPAYANAMPCYICSERLLGEGGYEVDSSMVSHGQPSRLAPEAEDKIIREVKTLIPPAFTNEVTEDTQR